jgi:Peptidase MA superfamily
MLTLSARLLGVLLLVVVLAACDAPGMAPAAVPTPIPTATLAPPTETPVPPIPTPAPTVVSMDALTADLQSVVDLERRAVESDSKDLFMAQIDQGDRDWYHYEDGQFKESSWMTERYDCVSNVRLDPKGKTAVADVALDACPGRYHVGMFFRLVGTRWFHSQPGLDEQGLRNTKKIGPFRVTYHAMDEGYLSQLERFAPQIYKRVSTVMQMDDLDVDVDLVSRPTDMPRSAFTTIALYNPLQARMSVLSPFFWPNGDGTEQDLDQQILVTLTHEFTHHAVRTAAFLQVPHWLNEGMAVYVGQENPTPYVRLVQIAANSDVLAPPDVLDELLESGDTADLAYAEGFSFVQYLTAKEGDGVLPQLLHALRQSGDLNQALLAVTGKGLPAWWTAWKRSLN